MKDNELIAEFMGLPLTKSLPSFTGGFKDEPFMRWKYNQSWDWLMPVVEKISGLHLNDYVTTLPLSTDIKTAHKAVVEFIKWYNQQKLL